MKLNKMILALLIVAALAMPKKALASGASVFTIGTATTTVAQIFTGPGTLFDIQVSTPAANTVQGAFCVDTALYNNAQGVTTINQAGVNDYVIAAGTATAHSNLNQELPRNVVNGLACGSTSTGIIATVYFRAGS